MALPRALLSTTAALRHDSQIPGRIRNARHAPARYHARGCRRQAAGACLREPLTSSEVYSDRTGGKYSCRLLMKLRSVTTHTFAGAIFVIASILAAAGQ